VDPKMVARGAVVRGIASAMFGQTWQKYPRNCNLEMVTKERVISGTWQ